MSGSANVEAEGRPLAIHSEGNTGEVAIKDHTVDWPTVPLLDDFELGEESGRIRRRIPAVHAIANERLCDARRRTGSGQSNPEVPILTEPISCIEGLLWQSFLADDHAGTATRHRIDAVESRCDRLRCLWWRPSEDAMILGDVDRSGIAPGSPGGAQRLELKTEFVGRPDIIIVEERHPLPCRLRYPAIAGCTFSKWDIVPHQMHSGIRHGSNHRGSVICRSFVNHDHFQAHSALLEHAGQGKPQQGAPIPRRNHYRDLGPVE